MARRSSSRAFRPLILALVACLLQVGGPAHAATPEEREAYRLYQAAAEDFDARDFEAAAEKLGRAHDLFPKPIILFKKAQALENLGRLEEARDALEEVEPDSRGLKAKVQAARRRLEVLLAEPVKVSVLTGEVTGARILLDGEDVGKTTPAVLDLERGEHVLRIEREGYEPHVIDPLVVRGRDPIVAEVDLVRATGRLRIEVSGGTFEDVQASLDGEPMEADPVGRTVVRSVPVGAHRVTCHAEGESPVAHEVTVEQDRVTTVRCALAPGISSGRAWAAGSLLVVGGGTFAYGGWLVKSYLDDVDHADATNQDLDSNKQIFGPVLLGVGSAAIVTGTVLLARRPDASGDDAPSEAALPLTPQLGVRPGGGWVGLGGSF
ncbi:MAG: PEGA domain-containing protein [Myxococcota bacterium]